MLKAITITQIYVLDQDQALDFYVGKLGFEVTQDLMLGPMRWLTVALPGQHDRQVLLERPVPLPHREGAATNGAPAGVNNNAAASNGTSPPRDPTGSHATRRARAFAEANFVRASVTPAKYTLAVTSTIHIAIDTRSRP